MDKKFLLIGEVFVDILMNIEEGYNHFSRLGGIFHAARAFSSMSIDYSLAFFSPQYLLSSIRTFSKELNAKAYYCLGIIDGSPNTMIIGAPSEAGNQDYINPLCEQVQYSDEVDGIIDFIKQERITDVLFFPGRYDNLRILNVLEHCNVRVHIDLHYDFDSIIKESFSSVYTVFTSTSSFLFQKVCNASVIDLQNICLKLGAKELVLKENRGGSRFFLLSDGKTSFGKAFSVKTLHSVGVGDVFDSVFLALSESDVESKLTIASAVSASYASTIDFSFYKDGVKTILSNSGTYGQLQGIILPWEEREKISIYLAAPDFPGVNKKHLNDVKDCLTYHNFRVRLPIQENGLITDKCTKEDAAKCFYDDLSLLEESRLLVAVVLNNDPGMYVELGMFITSGKPTIIYDPDCLCNNSFVLHAPNVVCRTLSELIDNTFRVLGEKR